MDLMPAAARTTRLRRPVTALCLTAALVAAPLAWAPAAFAAADPTTGTTQTEAADATPPAADETAPEAIETPAVEAPTVETPAVEAPVAEAPVAEAEPAADAPVREPASITVDDDTLDPDQPVYPGITLEATGFLPGEPVTVSITAPAGVQVDLALRASVGAISEYGLTQPADDSGRFSYLVNFSGAYYATNGAYTLHVTGEDSGLVLSKGITISGESAVSDDSNVFYPETPAISIPKTVFDPDEAAGSGIAVRATGFFPGERVTASLTSPPGVATDITLYDDGPSEEYGNTRTADERGRISYHLAIAGQYYAINGDYRINLTGERSGVVLSTGFTVAGTSAVDPDSNYWQGTATAAGRDSLPVTGGGDSALALGGLGALLLLAGGVLVARRHRRTV
ncbi:LPXTG cell wall anchor domain-containing protein [Clavibacter michiganensis]|nr:LPXTG cell wall anchor domain-containing protein [Clavibacter michiganensis]